MILRSMPRHMAYFNPRSSCEERPRRAATSHRRCDFNPRSSCEERHGAGSLAKNQRCDFNPRSSCEERPNKISEFTVATAISIHAPHARSDGMG